MMFSPDSRSRREVIQETHDIARIEAQKAERERRELWDTGWPISFRTANLMRPYNAKGSRIA